MIDTTKIEITVKDNEDVVFPVIWLNDEAKNTIHLTARLVGNNCRLTVVGIFLGTKNNSAVFNSEVIHEGLHTTSLTTIRSVFRDSASFNNDGMVRINKGAKDTNGYFQSKILLFGNAKGRSVPSLEIDENEVKAGHGSTIGRPDAEQLFYMRSRGLTEKAAEELLVVGFFDPLLQLLPDIEERIKIKKNILFYLNTK